MSGSMSLSKKRIRDGWFTVKDHPHLQVTSSDDESAAQHKLKPASAMSFTRGSPSKNKFGSDLRQDGNSSREAGNSESHKRLDAAPRDTRSHSNIDHGDEIGFEIEMARSALSSNTDIDQSSSRSSSLVFSISKVSHSEKSNELVEKDHLWESSRNDKTKTTSSKTKGPRVSSKPRNSRRKTPLFIDLDMADPNSGCNIRDETPKAHNRSSKPKSVPRKTRRSLIPKITDSSQTTSNAPQNSDDSTGHTHPSLEDSPDGASSERTHPSLEDSPGNQFSTPRSHPSLEDTPMSQTSTPQSHPSLEDTLITDRLSPRSHPSLEDRVFNNDRHSDPQSTQRAEFDSPSSASSEDVDGRWDRLRKKLLAVDMPSQTSLGVDGYWERKMEKVLEASSPRSLSDDMKDDLIQDCIDTGLPSPPKEHATKITRPVVQTVAKEALPKNTVASAAASPGIRRAPSSEFPSKIPTSASKKATRKRAPSRDYTNTGETDGSSLEFENRCMQETTFETVTSGLTGEFDDGGEIVKEKGISSCSISDIEVEGPTNIDTLGSLSSCSDSEEMKASPGLDNAISSCSDSEEMKASPGQDNAVSSANESYHTWSGDKMNPSIKKPFAGHKENVDVPSMALSSKKPNIKSEEKDESIKMPRIEVTLISSSSGEQSGNEGIVETGLHSNFTAEVGVPIKSPNASLFSDATESNISAPNTASTINSEVEGMQQQQNPIVSTANQSEAEENTASRGGATQSNTRQDKYNAEKAAAIFRTIANKGKNASSVPAIEPFTVLTDKCNIMGKKGGNVEEHQTGDIAHGPSRDKFLKSDSNVLSPKTHKIVIVGRKELMDAARNGRQEEEMADVEGETIDVVSTLTQETFSTYLRTPVPSVLTSTPVLRKSSKLATYDDKSHSSADLSVGFKNAKSFDTKLSASTEGIPSWRLDPSRSLTDFTIQILNQGNGEIATYHIHKHMVAIGPRRSEYLDTLFRSSELPSTQLTMKEKPANLVPILLDYMYCHDVEVEVTTETVLAYRKVALTFKVIPLLVKAAGFILQDVQTETMSTYVEQATRYKDKQILKLIVARCAAKIDKFDFGDPMWSVMEPETFLQVLSSPAIDREKLSAHLSILVTEYQTLHKYEIDSSKFGELTAQELLPIIDRSAALPLLEICDEYGCPEEFETLQKRCAYVMACYWKITSEGHRKRVFALLRSLPSNFTVDFLETIEIGNSATLVNAFKASRSLVQSKTSDASISAFSLGSLCNDFAGEDGYSIGSSDNAPLSWRADPKLTYSDWKIKVKHHGTDLGDVYNVHKHILSIGSHKSNFFADAFLSEGHTKARRGVTTIELAPAAAMLVPKMLDFIYTPEHRLDVSKDTAVAIRFLARVFGVWMLNKKLNEFILGDMTLENVLEYIDQAETFDDEKITTMAVRLCVGKIQTIAVDSPLLQAVKPDFFGRIVSSSELERSSSCRVSILIAKYFTLHDLSEALLGQLLQVSQMTEIDSTSALQLLGIIDSLKSKEMEIFRTIRSRCVQVITENWNELRENNREEMFEQFRRLEPKLVVDIFDWVESFYNEQQSQTMTMQVKLVKRYRKQLADARALRGEDIAQLQNEKDEKIAELTATKQDLEAKLRQHSDASARRAVRSSGAYRAQTPSKRTSIPSLRKTMIPSPAQKSKTAHATPKQASTPRQADKPNTACMPKLEDAPKPATDPKSPGKIQSVLSQNLAEARAMQNTGTETQTSGGLFGFSLFTCAAPSPAPQYATHSGPTLNGIPSYEHKLASTWHPK
jgi:hypothetical protein